MFLLKVVVFMCQNNTKTKFYLEKYEVDNSPLLFPLLAYYNKVLDEGYSKFNHSTDDKSNNWLNNELTGDNSDKYSYKYVNNVFGEFNTEKILKKLIFYMDF